MAPPHPSAATSPDPRATHAAVWRAEVGSLRSRQRRRHFPLEMRVGTPAKASLSVPEPWPTSSAYGAGLRFDAVDGLLDAWMVHGEAGVTRACAWLTRPGEPELHDRDLGWYAASVAAFDAHGMTLGGFRAVTRTGWLDVVTGERRVWKRLRL